VSVTEEPERWLAIKDEISVVTDKESVQHGVLPLPSHTELTGKVMRDDDVTLIQVLLKVSLERLLLIIHPGLESGDVIEITQVPLVVNI